MPCHSPSLPPPQKKWNFLHDSSTQALNLSEKVELQKHITQTNQQPKHDITSAWSIISISCRNKQLQKKESIAINLFFTQTAIISNCSDCKIIEQLSITIINLYLTIIAKFFNCRKILKRSFNATIQNVSTVEFGKDSMTFSVIFYDGKRCWLYNYRAICTV